MTLVIICRQIDISVGSVFSVCSVCTGLLAARGWPLPLVLPAAAALGALLGAMNGLLVARLRLPSIVVTLATMVALRQGLNLVRQGEFVNMQDAVQWFGGPQATGQWLLVGASLALLVVLGLGLRHLAAGRFVYAVGTDAEAARLAGIRPQLVTFFVFVFIGALTGLAAMMNIVQSPGSRSPARVELNCRGGSGGEPFPAAAEISGVLPACCCSPVRRPHHPHIEAYWESDSGRHHLARRRRGRRAKPEAVILEVHPFSHHLGGDEAPPPTIKPPMIGGLVSAA